jgi:5-(carboxyamino)imidazole ribonucleotide synthase
MQVGIIGIIGGGQLGKMLIEEGNRYNVLFNTLDPDGNSPASYISNKHIQGSLQDAYKINELANGADILTIEIEHINIEALKQLEAKGKIIYPNAGILEIVQDKGLQKQFYTKHNIPTAAYKLVQTPTDWTNALQETKWQKVAAKMRKGGYDGKGVALLNSAEILQDIDNAPWDVPTVLEEYIPNAKEISIIVNRNAGGEINCFDAVEMEFDAVANLVTYLKCPASISQDVHNKAKAIAQDVVVALNGIGIFAVEMFVTSTGEILVNEIAPRPHNSGHHTIEGCYTSQYEQLVRILLGKPLGSTGIIQPSAMINVLGANNFEGAYKLEFEKELLSMEGVYIHMYAKQISKPMRKLGHITVLAPTEALLKEKALKVMEMAQVILS